MLLFSYGVLLNKKVWKNIGLEPNFLFNAFLENYELIFDGESKIRGGATANIVENKNTKVWGAVFEISTESLQVLDAYEGTPKYYQRKSLFVQDTGQKLHEVWVYSRTGQRVGVPRQSYLNDLIEGALYCRLPADYISKLKTLKGS